MKTNELLGLNLTLDPRFRIRDGRLDVQLLDPKAPGLRTLDLIPRLFGRTLGVEKADKIFRRLARDRRPVHFFRKAVDAFRLRVRFPAAALERIPRTGPLVVVANHPLHGIDGLAIAHMITKVRDDVKVMLTTTFDGIPGIAEHSIFVNDGTGPSARSRSESAREAIDWLKQGHVVILFPAGQGSCVPSGKPNRPVDAAWQKGTSLLIRKSGARVLPVFVHGRPSLLLQTVRRVAPDLGLFLLVREIVRQRGSRVRLTVGESLSAEEVQAQGEAEQQVEFLRQRTYALGEAVHGGATVAQPAA
ncbi:MAG: 1-acyl-sn-glycerol-3-phosphate acyltransferase [Gemmataceae bacterium]